MENKEILGIGEV
jgi:quercetin 2,3-dioxygenase